MKGDEKMTAIAKKKRLKRELVRRLHSVLNR